MNEDERAALLEELRPEPEQGWVARTREWVRRAKGWLKRALANVLAFAAACLVGGLALNWLGADGRMLLAGLVLAGPVLLVALVLFLRWAVGQNFIDPLPTDLANAEPAELASQSTQPTVPVAMFVAKAGEPEYIRWEASDGDD